MGSESSAVAAREAIKAELMDAGEKILELDPSSDDLLLYIERAESVLARVWQVAPKSVCKALLPILKALIVDEILNHGDTSVKVAVASCCNELSRITAPDQPYPDELMKEFFKLYLVAFEQLSSEPGQNYSRAIKIVETVSEVRSQLILMDLESDEMVVEMFQNFLNNIRSPHPDKVFKNVEKIMSVVIEESDDVSVELLKPLLASVKLDNKKTAPISWELGKRVFENGAAKVQPYLREAVKELELDLHDYAEIVDSICNGENLVPRIVAPTVSGPSRLEELSRAGRENSARQSDYGNELNNENSRPETVVIRRRRGRARNSVIRPEERYQHAGKKGGRHSDDTSSDGYNDEKRDSPLHSGLKIAKNSSQKKINSVGEGSRKGRLKRKEGTINQNDDLEFSFKVKRKLMQNKAKKKNDNVQKKTSDRAISGRSNISETGEEEKDVEKIEEFPVSKPAKGKNTSKGKEKMQKTKRSQADRGEELVDLRIQVWWPMDETFYTGTITAYDRETKKHTILYDDDEIEILNLRKEKWELFDYEQRPQKQEAYIPSPAKEPVNSMNSIRAVEKTAKRKPGSLKKRHTASSSKRSKSEVHRITKSGDNSAPDFVHVNDESNDEVYETKDSQKDNGQKQESEKLMKKIESIPQIPEDVMEG